MLAWDRHKNVAGLHQLMGYQDSLKKREIYKSCFEKVKQSYLHESNNIDVSDNMNYTIYHFTENFILNQVYCTNRELLY